MNPTPAAIAAIRGQVTDWTAGDAQVAAALNTPAFANPAARATVPVPLTVAAVLGALSAGSLASVAKLGYVPAIRSDVNSQDRAACALWAQLLASGSVITQAEAAALEAVISATELDPSWPAQISWAQATLGRPVDAADIAEARQS